METVGQRKPKILIVDDSEMNRAILSEMLESEYDIIEAENGVQALSILQERESEVSLVLLDIVMPELDGYGVLKVMNQRRWIEDVPVIIISSESGSTHMERAYKLGVTDFINRPFDTLIVHRRVINTILLYAKQKRLMSLVEEQIYEKEMNNNLMIDILSHIVEFRNGESGLHVLHVRTLTEILLQHLIHITDRYPLSQADITLIGTASALHDIGKISIPSEVLNKPGRLTDEEFTQMKTHSLIGAQMLENLPVHRDEPIVKIAYEICRWHHERYDGRGYPDGLKGDEIPISAQIVSLADVYDALTSERCYKKAFSHEVAIDMILNGKCGTFNPLLMQCLTEISDQIRDKLHGNPVDDANQREMHNVAQEMLQHKELAGFERTLSQLEYERMKNRFYASLSNEIQFEYTVSPSMLTLSPWTAKTFGLSESILSPLHNKKLLSFFIYEDVHSFVKALKNTTPQQPGLQYDCRVRLDGKEGLLRFICQSIWSSEEEPQYIGTIGKALDISGILADKIEK